MSDKNNSEQFHPSDFIIHPSSFRHHPLKHPGFQRYHIDIKNASNIVPHPYRFKVKVDRWKLAKLLFKELFHYKGNLKIIKSRPCVYGVFSGPVGGFLPREHLCVGCLRCTTEYPDMVTVSRNPERENLGDTYFTNHHLDTVNYEAETGRVPIRGAGYRGKFGGEGFDGMWTDMSEIVRPTRDGIHGRESILTEVDIGKKLHSVDLENAPQNYTIPLPILFDLDINESKTCLEILIEAASHIQTLVFIPFSLIKQHGIKHHAVIPILSIDEWNDFKQFDFIPRMIALEKWDESLFIEMSRTFPHAEIILRTSFDDPHLLHYFNKGLRVFYLMADNQGRSNNGEFIIDSIRRVHTAFVNAKCRDQLTLIGGGGIIAAEHLPKVILCGLDVVVLNNVLSAALQMGLDGSLPKEINMKWGMQRLKNLCAAWRDQLLEIMGAMGIRDVRRLRGEMGRAMFQKDLEKEAFKDISKI